MKRSIARKWAAELDSGEYEQTKHKLRDDYGFCCLGILCNLHAQENPEIAALNTSKYEYFGHSLITPRVVMEWSGLTKPEGLFKDSDGKNKILSELNDEGMTFPEIAKIIRKNWKKL